MERINKRLEPYNRTGQTPVAIGSGGTDSETAEQAREMLGIMDYASIDTPANPVKLDGDGKIPTDRISIGNGDRLILIGLDGKIPTEAASVIQGVVPTVKLPQVVINGQIAKLLITNFDINTVYDITSDTGAVTLVGNEIQYLSTGSATEGSVRVNGFVYSFSQLTVSVSKPSIQYPALGSSVDSGAVIVTSSSFSSTGGATHVSSDWELSLSPLMSNPLSVYSDSVGLTSRSFSSLLAGSLYYVRVRHNSNAVSSQWSDVVNFRTRDISAVTDKVSIYKNDTNTIRITNYSPNIVYSITAVGGTASRLDDLVTFTPYADFTGNASVTINGVVYTFDVLGSPVVKPSIVSPVDSSVNTPTTLDLTASPFSASSAVTVRSSVWELSRSSTFLAIEQTKEITNQSNINKVTFSNLAITTRYYVRMKYTTTAGESSSWSDTLTFVTTDVFGPSKLVQYLSGDEIYSARWYVITGFGESVRLSDDGTVLTSLAPQAVSNSYESGTFQHGLYLKYTLTSDGFYTGTNDNQGVSGISIAVSDITPDASNLIYSACGAELSGWISVVLNTPNRVTIPVMGYGRVGSWYCPVAISGDASTVAFMDLFGANPEMFNYVYTGDIYIDTINRTTNRLNKFDYNTSSGKASCRVFNDSASQSTHSGVTRLSLNFTGSVLVYSDHLGVIRFFEKTGEQWVLVTTITTGQNSYLNVRLNRAGTVCIATAPKGVTGKFGGYVLRKSATGWLSSPLTHPAGYLVKGYSSLTVNDELLFVSTIDSSDEDTAGRYVSVFANAGDHFTWLRDIKAPGYIPSSSDFGSFISCSGGGDVLAVGDRGSKTVFIYR